MGVKYLIKTKLLRDLEEICLSKNINIDDLFINNALKTFSFNYTGAENIVIIIIIQYLYSALYNNYSKRFTL